MSDPFTEWHRLIDRDDPRFTRLATVEEAAEVLVRVEAMTRTSMWNMQRDWSVEALRDENGLNERAGRKGMEMRLVLPRRVVERRCPLASSHYTCTQLRLAPVAQPLMVCDGRRILVGDATGEAIWTSSDPGVVVRAVDFFDRVWVAAEPAVPEGEEPPFTRRMVQIALRLIEGATDGEIARALGVSERTVSADVREMTRRLRARSRAHAIALISGVDG